VACLEPAPLGVAEALLRKLETGQLEQRLANRLEAPFELPAELVEW